nr:DUF3304 domain-containing protein [Paraburkholderia sp. BCC1885]
MTQWKSLLVGLAAAVLLAATSGCTDANESNPADVKGFNYTDYYVDRFDIENEGQDLSAGGANMLPRRTGEERTESGGMCCIGIPRNWRPGMKLVVSWKVDKVQDGKTPGQWYTATTDVPPYGPHTYGFWVHFLPGDRIRVQILDKQEVPKKPDEHDPYIVQGVLDPQRNHPETEQ